jgi:pimeloyl-ACP methyl ester carboxylesterase
MRKLSTALLPAALLGGLCLPVQLHAQAVPAAITTDAAPDKAHPAAFDTFQLPSHGAQLNAFVYIATGAGPHPTVILLHGFPGNEKNLDIAQTLRRAGYDVLFFNYRGSWGSPGDFSFTHSIEDVQAAIAYLRNPANANRLRVDSKQIILIGHSMGGFMARYAGAQDPGIKAVGLISAADMAVDRIESIPSAYRYRAIDPIAKRFAEEGLAPLAGCTAKSLAEETVANADAWNVPNLAPKLAGRPVLDLTSDDGLAPSNDAFVAALKKAGSTHVTTQHFATDHSYSDQRIALETSILNWLATL